MCVYQFEMSSSSSSSSSMALIDLAKFTDLPDPSSIRKSLIDEHLTGLVSRSWSECTGLIKKAEHNGVFNAIISLNEESFVYYHVWKNTMTKLFEHKAKGWKVLGFDEGVVRNNLGYDGEHNYRHWTIRFVSKENQTAV